MPRYFFHLYNTLETRDEEGRDLPDPATARVHAVNECRQVISAEIVINGHLNLSHWIEVGDYLGETLMVVRFGDAVNVTG